MPSGRFFYARRLLSDRLLNQHQLPLIIDRDLHAGIAIHAHLADLVDTPLLHGHGDTDVPTPRGRELRFVHLGVEKTFVHEDTPQGFDIGLQIAGAVGSSARDPRQLIRLALLHGLLEYALADVLVADKSDLLDRGAFPLHHVDDYYPRLPASWEQHGGVFVPLYQSEALWLDFSPGFGDVMDEEAPPKWRYPPAA